MQQIKGYINFQILIPTCWLHKSLYGLQQVARQWNKKFDCFIKKYNLDVNNVNPCVYYNKDKIKTICDIFIDDGLYVNLNKQKLEDMFDYFNCVFKIVQKDM
jgi:hypothetical protein